MTYCVAMSLDAGMIFASDSRTNAGVDQIARFSKMKVFAQEGERVIVTLSSGNLSITQNALNVLEQKARGGDNQLHMWNAESMFDVARLLGDSLRIRLQRRIEESDAYFQMVHTQWGEGLKRVFAQLPDPDWS